MKTKTDPLLDLHGSLAFELEAIIKWTDRLAHRMDRICSAGYHNSIVRREHNVELEGYREIRTALREASTLLRPVQASSNRRIE